MKMHEKYYFGSIMNWEKGGHHYPLENFSVWQNWNFWPRAPFGPFWALVIAQMGQNCSTQCIWVVRIHITSLGPLTDLYGTPGPQKGPVLAPKGPFGGPLGTRRAPVTRFGPNCCQLVWPGWNHGHQTLWPGIWPLPGPQGPQKGPVWAQKGPNRVKIENCWKGIVWPIKICARRPLGQWREHYHDSVNQLREKSKKLSVRADS